METIEISFTVGDREVVDVTRHVIEFCSGRGDGLCHVFAPHATAGLALMETGSGSEHDLMQAVDRLFPRDDRYRHRHGSEGHGADHILPAFIPPFLVLAVAGGTPRLGTWQSIVLVDPNRDNPRRHLLLSFLTSGRAPSRS